MHEKRKVYVAGAFEQKEAVSQWMEILRSKGFEITADWTLHRPLAPFENNKEMAGKYAKEDIDGVKECDMFILKSEGSGSGSQAEFGAAIALNKQIYVIGAENRSKMFYYHPNVMRIDTFEDLLKILD